MEFKITEEEGNLPLEDWLFPVLKNYAEQNYGIKLDLFIVKDKAEANLESK